MFTKHQCTLVVVVGSGQRGEAVAARQLAVAAAAIVVARLVATTSTHTATVTRVPRQRVVRILIYFPEDIGRRSLLGRRQGEKKNQRKMEQANLN